ncbi:MAG TPA: response regulator transcription factor [Acidimicrobiales bacterium]|nr:response regulator transcription factor [Acidimicrobiales bacterium]
MSDHAPMGARMLIVEDDARIRLALQMVLEDEGHVVELAESAEAGLEAIARRPPDVVLVDLMLPGMDGFELCRRLRARSDVPILILTARSDSHDVVAGLEAGADDYVVKPAVPKELSARVRALLRRTTRSEPGPVNPRFGDIEVVPDAGTVRVAGVDVSLTKTEFKLLCELAQNPGRLLTREVLLDRVWGYGYFGDGRLVDVHVRRLRTKVEKDPTHPRHIVTVRGLGYKLEP